MADESILPLGGGMPFDDMFFGGFSGDGLNASFLQDVGFPAPATGEQEVNENPDVTHREPFEVALVINALHDDYQLHYDRGMFLFLERARNDIKRGSFTGLTMQVLNYFLERAYRATQEANQASIQDDVLMKPRYNHESRWMSFPTTVKAYNAIVNSMGMFGSTASEKLVRKKDITAHIYSEMTALPNVFGDVWAGDKLWLVTKAVRNKHDGLFDPLGRRMGEPTKGSFLQCVPYFEEGCSKPIFCTNFKEPSEQDLCFYQLTAVPQKSYQVDPVTGRIDWESGPSEGYTTIVYLKFCMADVVLVGTVIRRFGETPSESEIANAVRMFGGWNELKKGPETKTLDVDVNGKFHMWLDGQGTSG